MTEDTVINLPGSQLVYLVYLAYCLSHGHTVITVTDSDPRLGSRTLAPVG